MATPYAWYNSTSTDVMDFFGYIGSVDIMIFPIILLVIWVIITISTLRFGFGSSLTFSSFVVSILSVMFFIMGWIAQPLMYIPMLLTAVGIFVIWLGGSPD